MGNENTVEKQQIVQQVQTIPIMVPTLESDSNTLKQDDVEFLFQHLPQELKTHSTWSLLYSSSRDGMSMRTFYSAVQLRGPQFLIIKDTKSDVFGCFAPESWDKRQDFYGSEKCFIFKLSPDKAVYKSTKINKNYMYLSFGNSSHSPIYNGLGVGGKIGYFAIELDTDLNHGTSNANCATFSSPTLSSDRKFEVLEVEAWGFPMDNKSKTTLKNTQDMQSLIQQRAKKVDPKDFLGDVSILQQAGVKVGESGYFQEKLQKE
ncbi:TLD domain-containing protein [Acrasis kona]|uniref:MTOR-associated protein MEAK7 n=1 Tax=Acrasis kona TaxID=1008807 RepID=A0AAW2ZHV5_9EUKA